MGVRGVGGVESVTTISSVDTNMSAVCIWMYNVDLSPKNIDHCFSCSK